MTDNLSPRAQAILERHAVQDSERAQAARVRFKRIQEIRAAESAILHRATQYATRKQFEADNPENVATVNAHGKRATAEGQKKSFIAEEQTQLDRLRRERLRLEAEAPSPVLTAARISTELDRLGNAIAEIDVPTPTLAKGEKTLRDALPRYRDTVSALKAKRKEVEKAPLPAAHAKKLARDQITRLASQGLPQVSALFHGGEIGWPRLAPTVAAGSHLQQPINAAALAVCLQHEALIQKLEEIIDVNAAAFPNPLTPSERRAALAKIDSDIDTAQRLEAACVEALVAEGHRIFHRPDISVLAVLSYSADISF
jgi:hypothetical protein